VHKYLADLFINRNYALFMGGSFVSATGSWFLSVAISWLVWEIGKSELLLGLANFAQMGPLLVLGLVGGVVADRVDRRHLMIVTQVLTTAVSAVLAVAEVIDFASIPAILALLLVLGVAQSFTWPTWSAFIADLVGPERLRAAVALNSARFNLTRIVGPALAGVLLAEIGAGACLIAAAVGQACLMVALWAIHSGPMAKAPREPLLAAIREAVGLAWGTPSVRELLLVAGVIATVVLPYVTFLPAFAQNVLQVGPQGFGLMLTAVGAGAICGATISGTRLVAQHTRAAQGVLSIVTGAALVAFALATVPLVAAAALVVVGLGSIGYLATANATVQLAVPREVVGRVMGLWVVVTAGTTPLGGIFLGALAERIGLGVTFAAAGALCAVFSLAVALRPVRPMAAPLPGGGRLSAPE